MGLKFIKTNDISNFWYNITINNMEEDKMKIREKAFNLADTLIKSYGPRLAGTNPSLQTAKSLEKTMKSFCDKSSLDEFSIHKGAFLGWIDMLVIAYLLSILMLWFNIYWLAFILSIISILILVLEFFFYLPVIDFLFPKKKAMNAIGFIQPKKEIKNQVIISGHHDSARIFNFFIHQPKLYHLRVTGSIALVIFLTLYALFGWIGINPTIGLWLKIFLSLGCLLIIQMWFFASKQGTPGGGDNLIASAMAIEIGRYFSENKLENTQIIIASFDAEEEGLRGSRAFAKKYKNLFHQYPTVLLNSDCLYNLDDMFFLTSDINGTVKLDENLANKLSNIAENKGYLSTTKPIGFLTGGTDAGELAKVGVSSTTLIGMPWSNQERSSVYHTPNDTLDHVQVDIIDAAIDIFITYIEEQA
jgi:hypothetical protein